MMQRFNYKFSGQIIHSVMKLIFGISALTILTSASHSPARVSAQANAAAFPGKSIVEGTWPAVRSGHELISLGRHQILDWEPATGRYRLLAYDPDITGMADPFLEIPAAKGILGVTSPGHKLVYLGDRTFLEWDPTSGDYSVRRYDPALGGKGGPLSTATTVTGTFNDIRSGHELIYLGHHMILAWELGSGHYRIWLYDPTLTGRLDTFPGELLVEGTWPAIRTGHRLLYLGHYRLLDWEPASGRYRIWRYDPLVTGSANPLTGEPVAEGVLSNIPSSHELIALGGQRLLEWEPTSGKYRVWEYELTAVGAFNLEDIAANLQEQEVTGITVITHGWVPLNSSNLFPDYAGDGLMPLAEAIHTRAGGWLLDYDVPGDEGEGFFDSCTNDCHDPAAGAAGGNELVLLFDWGPEANELYTNGGWGEAAGDGLFSMLVGLNLIDPLAATHPPLHFIGHSFGTAVTSEVIERLAYFGVPVDQVTYLDPHDFNEGLGYDRVQRLFTLGKPPGYGATVWQNVTFADVYYQTRGLAGTASSQLDPPFNQLPPEGRPIPGAYNRFLNSLLPAATPNPYGFFDLSGDHSYIWNCFYIATVTGTLPATCAPPAVTINYAQTGYAFSRIAAGQPLRPAVPIFYGSNQGHKYSNPDLVDLTSGLPNNEGLAELGLTPEQVTAGRWNPAWNPAIIFNGNFAHFNFIPIEDCSVTSPALENTCPQPGWSHHGGGGSGHFIQQENGNAYLVLDGGLPSNKIQTHNWLYIPSSATHLAFHLRRRFITNEDELTLKLGGQTLRTYQLDTTDNNFIPYSVALPETLRGRFATLTFEITDFLVGSEVWIDNVRFVGPDTPHEVYFPVLFSQP